MEAKARLTYRARAPSSRCQRNGGRREVGPDRPFPEVPTDTSLMASADSCRLRSIPTHRVEFPPVEREWVRDVKNVDVVDIAVVIGVEDAQQKTRQIRVDEGVPRETVAAGSDLG